MLNSTWNGENKSAHLETHHVMILDLHICKAWRNAWWASSRGKLQLVFASSWGSIVCNVRLCSFFKKAFLGFSCQTTSFLSLSALLYLSLGGVRIHRPRLCNAHIWTVILCSSWMFLVCLFSIIVDRFDGVILESVSPASKLQSRS